MKKIVFLTLAVIAFCSCSNKEKYTVEGSVNDPAYNNRKIVSKQIANNEAVAIDTLLVESGKFSFKGAVDSIVLRNVYSTDSVALVPFVYIVEKGAITIDIVDNVAKIGGTPLNDKLQTFNDKFMATTKKGQELIAEYIKKQEAGTATPEDETALRESLSGLAGENTAMMVRFARENTDNILGEYCFTTYYFRVDSQTKEEMDSFATPKIKALLNL
ncbi:MAG: DUF4369 domain-containing protein [Dysgonamonadaceae bacterium]|jgi:hypothetical protein|nr:DUF4369 domain-containing protein [Dysgonamonadaceae bacterium]